jgi:hypothetical protein
MSLRTRKCNNLETREHRHGDFTCIQVWMTFAGVHNTRSNGLD